MGRIPSKHLCAHVHRAVSHMGVSNQEIDSFVSSVYHDRTIPLCKEIAHLSKFVISESTDPEGIDWDSFHHLSYQRDKNGNVTLLNDLPIIKGKKYQLLNRLIHLPKCAERDKSLTLFCKLDRLVTPLSKRDGAIKAVPMIQNIITPIDSSEFDYNGFRRYVRNYLDNSPIVSEYNWKDHILTLRQMAEESIESTKKRPVTVFHEDRDVFEWDNEQTASCIDSYNLACILSNKRIRELYEVDKCQFLTLTSGRPYITVTDDSHIYEITVYEGPIGRLGIRLQEGEKVRTLWMPALVFESLLRPMASLLENLVEHSIHQTAYLDDFEAAEQIRSVFFQGEEYSNDELFSIDQSSFTDNFPYKLQRIILEELADMKVLPSISLQACDLMVTGPYRPSRTYTKYKNWVEDVIFANGTPMGGVGLWMLGTLTHQLLIEYIQEQMDDHTDFRVQGDDALLKGRTLYNKYRETLHNLGCVVNNDKTMQSYRSVEYCGFIITGEQSVPMFRPHDLDNEDIRDSLSARAVQAYGQDSILGWILEHRSETLPFLRVAGLIPVDEEDEDYITVTFAQNVANALKSANDLLETGETREQQKRYYESEDSFPHGIFDEDDQLSQVDHFKHRSDYTQFIRKRSRLERLLKSLNTDEHAKLEYFTAQINDVCDDIEANHRDFLSGPRLSVKNSDMRDRKPSFLRPKDISDKTLTSAILALRLVNNTLKNSTNKEDIDYDDDPISR